ncbi:MAG: hypothetical protein ACOC22_01705 [bacterium]
MDEFTQGLTIGELKKAIQELDDNTPVVVSANIFAVPLKKETRTSVIQPSSLIAFFLTPFVELSFNEKGF